MIIWLASYPKSGNTLLRSLLSSYYFTNNGNFEFGLLKNISQFPNPKLFYKHKKNINHISDVAKYWLLEQENINNKKKLIFLKTHCALCSINNYSFTNSKNSLGAIYIVRDPRNLITSIKNHFQLSTKEAYEFLKNKRNALSTIQENKESLDFQPLGSWDYHLNSWLKNKSFPILKVRYEDLTKSTYETFKKVIEFINKISKSKVKFNRKKAINCVKNTSFEKLKKMENIIGFNEARLNEKNGKKIKFFYLGNKNNYIDSLDEELIIKINDLFKNDLKSNGYN